MYTYITKLIELFTGLLPFRELLAGASDALAERLVQQMRTEATAESRKHFDCKPFSKHSNSSN